MLIAWIFLIRFCAHVSSSPVSTSTPSSTDTEPADTEASAENPEYDLESSGSEGTDSIRSRRHDGQPKYCKLFCSVGLFLEMDEDGRIRGTGVNGNTKGEKGITLYYQTLFAQVNYLR